MPLSFATHTSKTRDKELTTTYSVHTRSRTIEMEKAVRISRIKLMKETVIKTSSVSEAISEKYENLFLAKTFVMVGEKLKRAVQLTSSCPPFSNNLDWKSA